MSRELKPIKAECTHTIKTDNNDVIAIRYLYLLKDDIKAFKLDRLKVAKAIVKYIHILFFDK